MKQSELETLKALQELIEMGLVKETKPGYFSLNIPDNTEPIIVKAKEAK